MKILLISNMFPPFIMGGAEMAAHSLALCLGGKGHQVHVLTSAPQPENEGVEILSATVTLERRFFPSVYQIYKARAANPLIKYLWHAHDHFHLHSEKIVGEVLQRVQPDLVNTHNLQGIGYNILRAIGRSGVPCVQTIHDFGLVCINMNRFKNGRECERNHLACQFSTLVKKHYFESIDCLSYWSPSEALLEAYRPFLAPHVQARAIPLPLYFETAPLLREETRGNGPLRLLYVGQIVPWKGVAFILRVLRNLSIEPEFVCDVVGGGASFDELKTEYADCPWAHFHGKVSPEKVSAFMMQADLLLVPSLWFENAPLVISQALQTGLPVFASRVGGLPELVEDDVSGRLLTLGDEEIWSGALRAVLSEPEALARWRKGAENRKADFAVDRLGDCVLTLFEDTMHAGKNTPSPSLQ